MNKNQIEIESTQATITTYNISIYQSWSVEEDQMIVELEGKKYFCISAHLQKDWSSDTSDWKLERLKYPTVEIRLVSVLKNGKAGNNYKEIYPIHANVHNGIFAHLFEAYNQELAKYLVKELVGA